MIHQVNLYKAEFRPIELILSFQRLAFGTPFLAAAALAVSIGLLQIERHLERDLDRAASRAATLDAQIESLAEAVSSRKQDSWLRRRNDAMQRELEQGTKVVALLRQQRLVSGDERRFSDVLEAFARRTTPGVWLEQIIIDEEGFRFNGQIDEPSRMPAYLEGLGSEPVFVGQRFSGLNIAHGKGALSFSLRSESIPGDAPREDVAMKAQR